MAAGVTNYPTQSEKRSTASNDSPIYSTINTAVEDDLLAYYDTYSSTSYTQGPDPYSSNPVLSNSGLVGLERDLDQWTIQSGQSGSEYAKLQYTKKNNGEASLPVNTAVPFIDKDVCTVGACMSIVVMVTWLPFTYIMQTMVLNTKALCLMDGDVWP